MYEFTIIEVNEKTGCNDDCSIAWLHTKTTEGKQITFWGCAEEHFNIDLIKKQTVPFTIEVSEATTNTNYKKKYGTDISIPENSPILIRPTP